MQRLPKIEPAIGALSLIGTRRSSGRTVPPHCVPLRSLRRCEESDSPASAFWLYYRPA